MRIPRLAAIVSVIALVVTACSDSGSSPSEGGGGASGSQTASGDCSVAVSWNNFQQPRWAAKDKPNIQETVEAGGGTYTDADADLDTEQQLTDIETFINQGVDVLILLAQNNQAVLPGVEQAKAAGIPIIAYDRLVEDPDLLYITFDNVGVGEAEAEAMFEAVPEGTYVLIKGDPGDPNASTFLPQGWDNAGLQEKIDAGDITIFDDQFTDAWDTETARDNMEAIIDAANDAGTQIDAVLAENDSTAVGVVQALQNKNYDAIPVSGQDGDTANLQYVAQGLQYVDVWKDANQLGNAAGAAALQLCAGKKIADVAIPSGVIAADSAPDNLAVQDFTTPGNNVVKSLILKVQPITQDNLQKILDAKWLTKDVLCKNATDPATAAPVCAGAAASPSAAASASPSKSP